MQIAITGATGFVGGACSGYLRAAGHGVVHLVRRAPGRDPAALDAASPDVEVRAYDPLEEGSVAEALRGAEAVVNLAGRPVLAGRWTDEVMRSIRDSRVKTTETLVAAMARLAPPPRVLVSASAVGYYGPRAPDVTLTEKDGEAGADFLASVCRDWERAASGAEAAGTRVVLLRIGIVLGAGGALRQMQLPFKLGLGGRIGSGAQVMSWIHVDDLTRLVAFCVDDDTIRGAVNATAPNPVTNAAFTKALGKALGRPTFLPVPRFALRLRFGRGADVVATGQRVLPAVAQERGFSFRHPEVEGALRAVYAGEGDDDGA